MSFPVLASNHSECPKESAINVAGSGVGALLKVLALSDIRDCRPVLCPEYRLKEVKPPDE